MKNYLLLFLILHFIPVKSQTFLNNTAVWCQSKYVNTPNLISEIKSRYVIIRDTTLFNKKYFILKEYYRFNRYNRIDSIGGDKWDTIIGQETYQYSFLREDSKRYYRLNSANIDMLVYDFNVKSGDRFENAVYAYGCDNEIGLFLDHQDSVCLGTKKLKSWKISERKFPSADYLIEGVGPNTGIFTPFCQNSCSNCTYDLHYFTINGDTLYKGNCNQTASILEPKKTPDFEYYYVNNAFQIDFKSNGTVKLYTLLGQQILSESITNGGKINFENHSLKTGIYLVEVETNSGIEYLKIVHP